MTMITNFLRSWRKRHETSLNVALFIFEMTILPIPCTLWWFFVGIFTDVSLGDIYNVKIVVPSYEGKYFDISRKLNVFAWSAYRSNEIKAGRLRHENNTWYHSDGSWRNNDTGEVGYSNSDVDDNREHTVKFELCSSYKKNFPYRIAEKFYTITHDDNSKTVHNRTFH